MKTKNYPSRPRNDKARALYFLIEMNNFSLADVINKDNSMFYKWGVRIHELEAELNTVLVTMTKVHYLDKWKTDRSYNKHNKAKPKQELISIYNKYNNHGS